MTITIDYRPPATLPNCDRCGKFTARPVITQWSATTTGGRTCHEELLCQGCATRQGTRPGRHGNAAPPRDDHRSNIPGRTKIR